MSDGNAERSAAEAARKKQERKEQRRGRAQKRNAFLAERTGEFNQRDLDDAMARLLAEAAEAEAETGTGGRVRKRARPVTRAAPTVDRRRWVPIGPSVVRRGQAEGRPRVTGRIRDLAVTADGRRAYAASAKGGVWYTEDGGATWGPVGAWTERAARAGGNNNAQVCGCLLVSFGATAAQDYVMVGTGELVPIIRPGNWLRQGGIGVLAGLGPADPSAALQPWEPEAGIAQLEGLGIFRLARSPASTPGAATGADADRVLAATSRGLFLGQRVNVAGPPARDEWQWSKIAALDTFIGGPWRVTDVVWISSGANGRIVVAIDSVGVAFSDDLGANWTYVTGLDPNVAPVAQGRLTMAHATANRFYVLGEINAPAATPTLWQIQDVSIAAPAAVNVGGVPVGLWPNQRDYDQALAVDVVGATDRIYIGGSTVQIPTGTWCASLWCFDTAVPATPLAASPTISGNAAPPAGAGADQPGLIGNNVHADVHVIRLTGPAGANRQVWVGCDGGVYVSAQAGRCNSFLARVTGLAALEPGFHATHPTSSHFVAIGCQDNGTQVRTGDTMWEETLQSDGGGLCFHPLRPVYLIAQNLQGTWLGRPTAGYVDPLHRVHGGTYGGSTDREHGLTTFYSGPAAIQLSPTAGRIALGTNRVWYSDNIGGSSANTWRVIPVVTGAATDPRPGGTDPVAQRNRGVPAGGALGGVYQLRWVTPRDLLALYSNGLVRYTQHPTTNVWTATTLIPGTPGGPTLANTVMSDVFPVPGTSDFYLATTGDPTNANEDTVFFFDSANNTFTNTALRRVLDQPGPPVVPGPLDPAYALCVDPLNTNELYVGTVTGVWHGVRTAGVAAHNWTPLVNGLPQATIQDLSIWADPAGRAGMPRLLRAAVQSRGVWEVNLAADEPRRTYARVHAFDDRRFFPTLMQNPRKGAGAPLQPTFASPDIVIRPAANPASPPTWQLPGTTKISAANVPAYQLWTFQTAFRWIYPSILADASWSDQLGDLIQMHRNILGLTPGRFIDRQLWDAVVRNTRLDANGAVSATATDPWAVYRAPWQSAAALNAVATEVDVVELVHPTRVVGNIWRVYKEQSTVDVLLHHRESRPLAAGNAVAALLWRSAPTAGALLATAPAGIVNYARSLFTATPNAVPAGWNEVPPATGSFHRLPVAVDARLPRAVSIDVNLGGVTAGHHVLILTLVASDTNGDRFDENVVGAPSNMNEFVRAWPHCAMRLVRLFNRPA